MATDASIKEAQEDEEAACAQLLIELAFLLPKGTDVNQHSIAQALTTYVKAVRDNQYEQDSLAMSSELEEWLRGNQRCGVCGLNHFPGIYSGDGKRGWAECHYYQELKNGSR